MFVVIRYWLLTFVMDFLPSRELRLLLVSWLNALVRDPMLQEHQDGLTIVRKLIQVVKDCKEVHTRGRHASVSARKSITTTPTPRPTHLLGENFVEAISKNQDDSNVDLDFIPDDCVSVYLGNGESGNAFSFTALLQQTFQRNILQQSRASISASITETHAALNSPPFTSSHGALSLAFVKTIGRLGRWKRVLNSRQTIDTGIAVPANVSTFDLEMSATSDLLTVRGGVEQYLKMIEPHPPRTPVHPNVDLKIPQELTASSSLPEQTNENPPGETGARPLRSLVEVAEEEERIGSAAMVNRAVSTAESQSSIITRSTESFGSVLTSELKVNPVVAQVQARPPWRFVVVSIDDLDLSDSLSEAHIESPFVPPGLRKAPRKLPLRRDFEFVRRSGQSVSSMGIRSRDSVASESSAVSSASVGGGLGTNIQQWQVNAIVDSLTDDGGDGDVEEASRRLEGQINPQRRKEKALKVDGWVRAIQERMAAGDFGDEQPRFFDEDEDNEDEDATLPISTKPDLVVPFGAQMECFGSAMTGTSAQPAVTPPNQPRMEDSGPISPLKTGDAKPALEDVVHLEILQSRVSSRLSTLHDSSLPPPSQGASGTSPKLLPPPGRKSHRDVLDWTQYLKDRARWKAESRFSHKTSALAAVRGRFNLMANFVISEIILTHPSERHTLVSKFIRIAIKAYSYSNFHTVAAILAGLLSEWVKKAMYRQWHRVGPWEMQIFQKLSQFVTPEDNFKAMHQAVRAMVDAKPMDARSHASTIMSGSTSESHSKVKHSNDSVPSACVPFIGIYLSQLCLYGKLPDLIDPTSPRDPVGMDSQSLSFDSPAHPDVLDSLTPLPPSMQLEPLINVHKQRLIAGVIKDLIAGQHLASRMNFTVDKKLY
ncbi:ras guanine nucleotide exchange factor domain-containing protein [Pisolithus marmoratus]|nr:ras guanine nucleotide exchange factor domain-containing protein [Pisolithus marmoratus]